MAIQTRSDRTAAQAGAPAPLGGAARWSGRRRLLVVLLATVLVVLTVSAAEYDRVAARVQAVTGPTSASAAPTKQSVGGLDPALRLALDRAIEAARADGVGLRLTSGWRSWAEQQRLFDAAVQKYGSPRKASHWVLPPDESAHVRGEAVDVGPRAGAKWLERHGAEFGLCRRYDNEWWHFELLVPAGSRTCPGRQPYAGAAG